MTTRITRLFSIKFPIIQAGMVWCSGWKLASAVSNAGGLGLIGSGSMGPEVLREHVCKARASTWNNFGVNIPLLHSNVDEIINIVIEEQVPVVFTSAGNPAIWTKKLKNKQIKVVHVISNLKFARKSEDAGVDAIVAEGVEAGGHNGKEENTTFTLIPLIKKHTNLPVIAAGGIATGRGMLAAIALGADGVQIGSRFAASIESSAHINFKKKILATGDGGTRLAMKQLNMVRIIRNELSQRLEEAELRAASTDEINSILGKGRSRLGMFEGNITEGELEIGQVAAIIDEIKPASEIVAEIIGEFNNSLKELNAKNL